jgi:hypothetical protein
MAKTSKRSALELFSTAREWLTAADELLRVQDGKPDAIYGWRHLIYFCYLQSIELTKYLGWFIALYPDMLHSADIPDEVRQPLKVMAEAIVKDGRRVNFLHYVAVFRPTQPDFCYQAE